jgi:hypothetical protein
VKLSALWLQVPLPSHFSDSTPNSDDDDDDTPSDTGDEACGPS